MLVEVVKSKPGSFLIALASQDHQRKNVGSAKRLEQCQTFLLFWLILSCKKGRKVQKFKSSDF